MRLPAFDELCALAHESALIESIEALLGWDERTYLPPAAGEYRAEQMTYLAGVAHQKRTNPRLGELLGELAASDLAKDPHSDAGATIRELKRQYDKRIKLPQSLVEELTRAVGPRPAGLGEGPAGQRLRELRPAPGKALPPQAAAGRGLGYRTTRTTRCSTTLSPMRRRPT